MTDDSSTPKSAPDPHHPSALSMPEGNARRWAVLAFPAFWGLMALAMVLPAVI